MAHNDAHNYCPACGECVGECRCEAYGMRKLKRDQKHNEYQGVGMGMLLFHHRKTEIVIVGPSIACVKKVYDELNPMGLGPGFDPKLCKKVKVVKA